MAGQKSVGAHFSYRMTSLLSKCRTGQGGGRARVPNVAYFHGL